MNGTAPSLFDAIPLPDQGNESFGHVAVALVAGEPIVKELFFSRCLGCKHHRQENQNDQLPSCKRTQCKTKTSQPQGGVHWVPNEAVGSGRRQLGIVAKFRHDRNTSQANRGHGPEADRHPGQAQSNFGNIKRLWPRRKYETRG